MLDNIYKYVTPAGTSNTVQYLINHFLERMANVIYPFYCRAVPPMVYPNASQSERKIIVSLTSFPDRINDCHLCINSILRQTRKADKVILWLAKSQFPKENDIPDTLQNLKKYGLEISFCKDLKSYKKIFYTAQNYTQDIIITADDDVLYPEYWIEELYNAYTEHPACVICYRGQKIWFDLSGKVQPYVKWKYNDQGPSYLLVPTGVGGVLYPPGFFLNVDFNEDTINKLAPTMDDLWLRMVGIVNGYPSYKIKPYQKEWFSIRGSQRNALIKRNVNNSIETPNDLALRALTEYYKVSLQHYIDM